MINALIQYDQKLFLFLNQQHFDQLDPLMLFISYNYIPGILILLGLVYFSIKKFKKGAIWAIFFAFLTIGLADSISSRIFKPGFERLRPCHEPKLAKEVHLAGKKCAGGKFGFVSSHAANTFGVAIFIFLLFKFYTKKTAFLFVWAFLVSYSRIYLAKHYPFDIFFGSLLGLICGYISYKFFSVVKLKYSFPGQL